MDLVTIVAAVEHGGSKAPFYIVGGSLAVFAVLAAGIGLARPELSERSSKTLMGVGAVLVVAAIATMLAVS